MQQLRSIEAGRDEPAAAGGKAARSRELYEEMHEILERACGAHSSRWGHLQGRGLPGGFRVHVSGFRQAVDQPCRWPHLVLPAMYCAGAPNSCWAHLRGRSAA